MRVDPNFNANLVTALDRAQASSQGLTSELSSGMRVNLLGDDPVAAGDNVVLLNQIQQDDSFTTNSNLVTGELQVADSALGSVVTELTSAISLATSASSGTMNASNLKSVSSQISGILDEVQALANTSYQGQFIFAGGQTSTKPFTSSGSSAANVAYNGDQDVNYLQAPSGERIQLNVPGDQIFLGNGTSSVFGSLSALVADFASGTVDSTKAVTDLESLNNSLNYVSQQRVTIDNSLSQVSAVQNAVTNEKTQLTAAQTDLLQADVALVATQLSLSETQQTALEDVIAQLNSSSNSLFSKLA